MNVLCERKHVILGEMLPILSLRETVRWDLDLIQCLWITVCPLRLQLRPILPINELNFALLTGTCYCALNRSASASRMLSASDCKLSSTGATTTSSASFSLHNGRKSFFAAHVNCAICMTHELHLPG